MLTTSQYKTFRVDFYVDGEPQTLIANVRHDDQCHNGHNTFAITATLYGPNRHTGEPNTKHESGKMLWLCACGCLHEMIAKYLPELAHLIKWHLCSTDGPMHYLANTTYHASDLDCWGRDTKDRDLDAARHTAIWPEATDEDLIAPRLKARLTDRLPALLVEFKKDIEALGFSY